MIDVKVIASGSGGNCTVLTSDSTTILLDAGIKFSTIQQALNFRNPTAVLITHEHGDHAHKPTIKEFLKRGVEILMTRGTAEALKLEPRHNLCYCSANVNALVAPCFISCEPVQHDAAEPVSFTVNDGADEVVYITDTGWLSLERAWGVTKLLIETNFDSDALTESGINEKLKERILGNHLSIEQVVSVLEMADLPRLKEIWLMHISERHGKGEEFRRRVEAVVPAGVKVHLAME